MTSVSSAGFELIDHTADVAVRAWGASPERVFEQAALGMASLAYDVAAVEPRERHEVRLEAPDRELLLAAWLNELLYLMEARRLVFAAFVVERLGGKELAAVVVGERLDPARHHVHAVVKAATLHDLSLRQSDRGWEGHVLLDV
jgi:SHS2 domain-containing protein